MNAHRLSQIHMGDQHAHVFPGLPIVWFAIYVLPEPHGLMVIGVISLIANILGALGAWQAARAEQMVDPNEPNP